MVVMSIAPWSCSGESCFRVPGEWASLNAAVASAHGMVAGPFDSLGVAESIITDSFRSTSSR